MFQRRMPRFRDERITHSSTDHGSAVARTEVHIPEQDKVNFRVRNLLYLVDRPMVPHSRRKLSHRPSQRRQFPHCLNWSQQDWASKYSCESVYQFDFKRKLMVHHCQQRGIVSDISLPGWYDDIWGMMVSERESATQFTEIIFFNCCRLHAHRG